MPCPKVCGVLVCLWAGSAACADELGRAQIAAISGSERLQIFAFGKLLETGAAPHSAVLRMKQSMIAQGFYYEPGQSHAIATGAWVAPILSYDGNINGGVLQDSFSLNGSVFEADPAFRAKAGVVMGLSGGGVARLAWANGRYVEGRLRGEAVWSPEYQIGRSNAELGLCSRNHVSGWDFIDLCQTVSASQRELGSSVSQETTLTASRLFRTTAAYHEVSAEFTQSSYDTGDQPSVTLSWLAVWDKAATNLSLTKAAPINGETALANRIAVGVQWLAHGRALGVGLWHQDAGGGSVLGTAREDQATGISISYDLRPGLTAQISYSVNQSSVDLFDYSQVSLNLRFDALDW